MYALVRTVVTLLIGVLIGVVWIAHPATVYKYRTDVKTVHDTAHVPVPTLPDSCRTALHYAAESQAAAESVDTQGDAAVALLGDARIAIVDSSIISVNKVESDLRPITDDMTSGILTIGNNKLPYHQAISQCKKEVK